MLEESAVELCDFIWILYGEDRSPFTHKVRASGIDVSSLPRVSFNGSHYDERAARRLLPSVRARVAL